MREEFLRFLDSVTAETKLEEVKEHCQTQEALDMVFQKLGEGLKASANPPEELSAEWKKKALDAFADMPAEKITTKEIQIRLQVSYHLALMIKEWLLKEKGGAHESDFFRR